MTVLSLGAGVQSSAMLLMALEGRFGDVPDCAVFADAGWEPKAVYEWLALLESEVAPFQIHRVSAGKSIRDEGTDGHTRRLKGGGRFVTLPFYVRSPDKQGMGRRQCTSEYKLRPMQRFWRSLGATAKNPIECWIGISTDEAIRMKPSRVKYAVNRWPLIEAKLSRYDCSEYLKTRMGSAAPKSACIGCPFHDDGYWARMRSEAPAEFADACKFDEEIRSFPGMRNENFLHRSMVPLGQITEFMHENNGRMFVDAFGNECEGLCGL